MIFKSSKEFVLTMSHPQACPNGTACSGFNKIYLGGLDYYFLSVDLNNFCPNGYHTKEELYSWFRSYYDPGYNEGHKNVEEFIADAEEIYRLNKINPKPKIEQEMICGMGKDCIFIKSYIKKN